MRPFIFSMAKDLQWFKFSPLNWMTGRIRKEKDKVQIAFIELMCQYWKNQCNMTIEQAELEVGDAIHQLLKKKIVKSDGDRITIGFLDEQMVSIEQTSVQKRNAAKSRWNASAMHVHKGAMQNDADKIREDKKRDNNTLTHGKGKKTITIKRVFAGDPIHKIHDLREYFRHTGQLDAVEEVGLTHFEAFVEANSGKVFNEPDHLYNSFRIFCKEYSPPPRAPNKYEAAEYNKTLWTLEAWEEHYRWRLDSDNDFRQHFGYGQLQVSKSVGS